MRNNRVIETGDKCTYETYAITDTCDFTIIQLNLIIEIILIL